jgi:opine dehydrogenase
VSRSLAVAVIGAGNVGCALAADLTLRGFEVRLFNRSSGRLQAIRDAGGITVTGAIEGFADLSLITNSMSEAVDGADVVAVTLPTATLPSYVNALGEVTGRDQLIWLNPGHSGGALYLWAAFSRAGLGERKLCQLTTASHISRMTSAAEVRLFMLSTASVAALPTQHLEEARATLDTLLPGQFGKAQSVLETDLTNINAIIHPPGMVCNAGWIEAATGGFGFYSDGNTPAVAKVMDAIDTERLELCRRLEIPAVGFAEVFWQLGFVPGDLDLSLTVGEAIQRCGLIHPVRSPPSLDHRYLHEDVGWGLVPWMHLATAVGCPVPTLASLTHLAGLINGVDYASVGLTLQRMGLAGKTPDQIRKHVQTPTG